MVSYRTLCARDWVEAFRWFHLAASFGGADAQNRQDEIKARLTPGQLEQALGLQELRRTRFRNAVFQKLKGMASTVRLI